MSIHLVGGGWSASGDPQLSAVFLAESAVRAAASGRLVPRIGVLIVVDDGVPSEDYRLGYPASFTRVDSCRQIVLKNIYPRHKIRVNMVRGL